jgi:membrane protein
LIKKIKEIEKRITSSLRNSKIVRLLKRIVLPGFGGVPVFEVIMFFYKRLMQESVTIRASAIAFRFFLALFPGLIFTFTLIPYIPIENIQNEILALVEGFLPSSAFELIESTLSDVLLNKKAGLTLFGFIMAIYFSSIGINLLLQTFDKSSIKGYWKRIAISFYLTILLSFMIILGVSIQIGGEVFIGFMHEKISMLNENWFVFAIKAFKLIFTLFVSITTISVLYHYGTSKKDRFRFYTPGAFLATILILITSYGFGFYVENFSQYNRFYGSLGALIVLLMWLYLNAYVLISGFEFNIGISRARRKKVLLLGEVEKF